MINRGRGQTLPLLLAFSLIAVSAQEPAPLEPFRTEVNYIRVDMYPTADGKPVIDLRADEVELLDEGELQKIDRFEHVLVRGARSQQSRREPSTLAEMREAVQDVRARLFVLFLDTEHVEFGPAYNVKSPLVQSLNQLIGGDDLVAIMTPGMQVRDITFRRRTASIEELLQGVWSERDHRLKRSAEEDEIAACYPTGEIADEMIFRRREVRTLDAIEELVRHLRFVREERKAVIAISQGWRLFREDPVLRRPVDNPVSPVPPLGLDPRTGRIGVVEQTGTDVFDPRRCEQERQSLSMLRNDLRFVDILQQANTANTSFYPVDPRGLVAFDEHIVPVSPSGGKWRPMVDLTEDSNRLRARNESLRTMAEATDGMAVVQNGDLSAGMRRIIEDLSSYYLIGYYSTRNLDGQFHRLTVRIKRPGVRVRARTGYLAASRADEAKAKAAAGAVAGAPPGGPRSGFSRETAPCGCSRPRATCPPAPLSSGAWRKCPRPRNATTGLKVVRRMRFSSMPGAEPSLRGA
jgi:VWFA-related protein